MPTATKRGRMATNIEGFLLIKSHGHKVLRDHMNHKEN